MFDTESCWIHLCWKQAVVYASIINVRLLMSWWRYSIQLLVIIGSSEGILPYFMMMSSDGNIFRVTGPLWGQSTGHWWIPLTKASDPELWCFFICAWTNGCASNLDPSDLRRHRAHYDVTVMFVDTVPEPMVVYDQCNRSYHNQSFGFVDDFIIMCNICVV